MISIIGAIIGAVQGDTASSSISGNGTAQSGGTNSQPAPQPAPKPAPQPAPKPVERTPEQVRASLMRQLNEFRASQGVAPVSESAELNAIAQKWAEHEAAQGTFNHSALKCWTYTDCPHEHIAIAGDPTAAIDVWKRSKDGHREGMYYTTSVAVGHGFARYTAGPYKGIGFVVQFWHDHNER
ncbi:CAP domain-containing protein [Corynebacterium phoceense]|uniref:CAP domain-containing protein n=1 Tax=Corynebacterium phoceense TaxID=1686286 RepID=UPI00211CA512|nr:CAP domain-containing protein [Corynebacterium phoceense]